MKSSHESQIKGDVWETNIENKIVLLQHKSSTNFPCSWNSCPNIYDTPASYSCCNSLWNAPHTCYPPLWPSFHAYTSFNNLLKPNPNHTYTHLTGPVALIDFSPLIDPKDFYSFHCQTSNTFFILQSVTYVWPIQWTLILFEGWECD